jgi:hypothetical protein
MIGRLMLGAVAGGLAAYLWGTISWMALPWHHATLRTFTNEVAVARVIEQNAPTPGVYLLLPYHWQHPTLEQQSVSKGLMLFGAVRRGSPDMTVYYLRGLGVMALGALFISALILMLPPLSYWQRVRLSAAIGLGAGVLVRLADWNWWSFSMPFTLVGIADLTITWFLAGLAIAKVVRRA